MIPHRLPNNAIFGNDLKLRVTACRKRLRSNRNLQRVQFANDSEAFSSESVTSFPDACSVVRESIADGGNDSEFRGREAWLQLEHEVGIT
jgi:hypothetical protein